MRFALLLLPWLELFTLIELGIHTSALTAMAYVVVTVFLGLLILQRQGRGMFEHLRQAQDGRILGPQLLIDDMSMGLAGLLLIFPGMISDVAALIVMIGPLRRRLLRADQGPQSRPVLRERQAAEHETIEGDFRRLDDDDVP